MKITYIFIGCILPMFSSIETHGGGTSRCVEPTTTNNEKHGFTGCFEDGENGEDGEMGGYGGNGGGSVFGNGGNGGNGGDAD